MTFLSNIPVSAIPQDVNEKHHTTVTIEDICSSSDESMRLENEEKVLNPKRGVSEQKQHTFTPLISERAVNEPRPLKVIYIGAGISGILAAIKFREAVPGLDLTIYEKNPELGGTWYENQYPGCACGECSFLSQLEYTCLNNIDVPSHVYQLSFESWTGWSQFFSGADEIREYWNRVSQKYDVRKHIKFQSRCVGARWNDATGKWFVQIFDEKTGSVFEDSADIFMTGTGLLNEWKWPSIPGLQSFKGKLLHSACWDNTYDMKVRLCPRTLLQTQCLIDNV